LDGLVGNAAIPRISGGATTYWLPENGTATESDQAFGQVVLTPHRCVADTAYSKELLMQSSVDVEAFVRDDLARVLAIAIDLAALAGTGNAGQPLGILNTSGLATSVTFGAAATWPKVVSFETNVATSNADDGALAYVTSPGSRGKWKGIARFTNTGMPIWADDNTVNGYPAYATNQVPSDKVIFGNWRDLVIASWAGIDVVVDPYSLKKQGLIEVTVTIWTDIGIRHTVSFCISTDSGAQ
jgi:HK97 family phage major capsid protein